MPGIEVIQPVFNVSNLLLFQEGLPWIHWCFVSGVGLAGLRWLLSCLAWIRLSILKKKDFCLNKIYLFCFKILSFGTAATIYHVTKKADQPRSRLVLPRLLMLRILSTEGSRLKPLLGSLLRGFRRTREMKVVKDYLT